MRLGRALPAIPAAAVALLFATAAPAGAIPACTTGCTIFGETGSPQAFVVPSGVVGVTVELYGAGGGEGYGCGGECDAGGGNGGFTVASLTTAPGSTLEVQVGGEGGNASSSAYGDGGYNGGGNGSFSVGGGGGGGGATDVRTGSCAASLDCTTASVAAVAGGGGGGSGAAGYASGGGEGGGVSGGTGGNPDYTTGGGPGTQSGPGAAGSGADGTGDPGVGAVGGAAGGNGGGGGGGYYGGGGGESDDANGSGGGGGSGYVSSSLPGATEGGVGSGDGIATIYWAAATSLSVTAGGSVTITAYVPLSEDGGTETFTLGSTTLCSDVSVADGAAACTTSTLPAGTDDVTATLTSPPAATGFQAPGSLTLDADLAGGHSGGTAGLDAGPGDPWNGTTEVFAISAAAVPVPTTGAGIPAGVPPLAALLILVGAAGIVTTRRRRRAA